MSEVEVKTTKNSGPGGQHRNKTESAVVVTHRPTGIKVRIGTTRSQFENKALALAVLAGKLAELERAARVGEINADRRLQVGSGQRGDKVRTYRTQDDRVVDHRTGQTWSLSRWRRGLW
jgi:peptide chain release factor 1